MKVLIVAKTRQGGGACIGAITEAGKSARLVPVNPDERWGIDFNVGDVWDVDVLLPSEIIQPHVENLVVHSKHLFKSGKNSIPTILKRMPPREGGTGVLFEGLTRARPSGALFISEESGIPPFSTMFWRPNRPLRRDSSGKRIRYTYPAADGDQSLAFVGFQEPVEEIPADTLLRVSLAHWWRPEEHPDAEKRCFVQLSGWFGLEEPIASTTTTARTIEAPSEGILGEARGVLSRVFGFHEFKPLQEQIITNVIQGRDSLGIMPTGAGKSLCFQLPAILSPGLTVVVSPLISLMDDQIHHLESVGVPAVALNSTLRHADYLESQRRARSGAVKLLYVAPETLLRPEIQVLLDESRTSLITIDEAHCISEWGHDFRPEYRKLGPIRQRHPKATCLALTATATKRVRDDIRSILGIAPENVFVAGFDRPNLHLEVRQRGDGLGQVLDVIKEHRGESGIIYCSTRKQVEELVVWLTEEGVEALPYHAGMDNQARRASQTRFQNDDAAIVVATIAFGMGIDKPNVRFVIHYNLPDAIETYYQQVGRAGRDGLRADCLLLYGWGDIATARHFIKQGSESESAGRTERLRGMQRYAESTNCRRRAILRYFDDPSSDTTCEMCDNCLGESGARVESVREKPVRPVTRRSRIEPIEYDPALFEILRGVRRKIAEESAVPPFVVFSDRSLMTMAGSYPRTRNEFLAIHGVGEHKAEVYGERFLEAIRSYVAEQGITDIRSAPRVRESLGEGRRRYHEIGEAFGAGMSIADLEKRFGVIRRTILGHLSDYVRAGNKLDPIALLAECSLPESDCLRVLKAFEEHGLERLAPVREAFGGEIEYEDLHILRMYRMCLPG